ncbi:hypothetical protein PP7435_CHR1-0467 [Komagataella phaffii CBS 7435]|uniref:Protein DCG1 n=2 Tax=Komagataella phaffii TaxID=460519 RepID=C4QW98_KOMPG|nr:uncharacterized protein PAS_chr1-1_0157 [Komagataella phaffii GS115]AOA61027.1 GQ67_02735T0 [Komagataella phaffii]CAH2446191.1 hypothetical protein BQ9382_C1-2415 [Komagataella phaffii CBS 7435]AOA65803.1 GQ68_02513T0 [Komagataella phaffii GS115]CAY67521.1 Protein of unknown function, expression is sensitive to nitrogen catabolite repression [Komagataella phaffii GS115]CCA36619.1 hypothetical protein PP7435_CHR1-0467 [Komagataella phaffii CBS 7435]
MAPKKILVVNPNSSKSITDNLEQLVSVPHSYELQFYTAPPEAPKSINNEDDALVSAEICFPALKKRIDESPVDGVLVCCFSDHPLVPMLTKEFPSIKALGIFQGSLLYSLGLATDDHKFAILTSNNQWERILDDSLLDFFYGKGSTIEKREKKLPSYCLPTIAANVEVLELQDPKKFKKLQEKVQKLVDEGAKIILLGCAGLSGLDLKFKDVFPQVKFVDTVKVGVQFLVPLIEY